MKLFKIRERQRKKFRAQPLSDAMANAILKQERTDNKV